MNNCPNCAPYDCYHICPNSPHYYSPEQERMDDAFYGDDDNRERYAATVASEQYIEDDDYESAPIGQWVHPVDAGVKADDWADDDIPF